MVTYSCKKSNSFFLYLTNLSNVWTNLQYSVKTVSRHSSGLAQFRNRDLISSRSTVLVPTISVTTPSANALAKQTQIIALTIQKGTVQAPSRTNQCCYLFYLFQVPSTIVIKIGTRHLSFVLMV